MSRRTRSRPTLASRVAAVATAGCLFASGCVTTSFKTSESLARKEPTTRILLMPADVELSELNAGGIAEPNAAWTKTAEGLMSKALADRFRSIGANMVVYPLEKFPTDIDHPHVQLAKLHGAVGASILLHQYNPAFVLPSKGEKFEWTLGPGVAALRTDFGADYALFIHVRDSYTSAGRAVAIVLAAALFGVGLQGGVQQGFASLVDLRTGEIVWFNRLVRGEGDLRNPESATESVSALLAEFPK